MIASMERWLQERLGRGGPGGNDEGPWHITLDDNQACSLPPGRAGVRVECISGTVWVTCEGDPADHVLEVGEAFETDGVGRLAMMAFGPSRVLVVRPGACARAPHQEPATGHAAATRSYRRR